MKPPKTVTLIDLEGKPLRYLTSNKVICWSVEWVNYNYCWIDTIDDTYFVTVGMINRVAKYNNRVDALQLCNFINDQLTFIRNKMWETLAIYQATLGRYWEVPVMQYDQPTIDYLNLHKICHIVRRLETKISMPYIINGEDFVGEQIVKNTDDDRCILVTPSVYLKHYPDVFSKLTPWNGE